MIRSNRIGIYGGSFDPVHIGHITFALQAIKEGRLDSIYFLPERLPPGKDVQELFGHRVAMIKQAIKPYRRLKILEVPDRTFSVKKTLPLLQQKFDGKQLVFIFGSDKVSKLGSWPHAKQLLESSQLIIGLRETDELEQIEQISSAWRTKALIILPSFAPDIASSKIRFALNNRQEVQGLLKSVSKYIRRNWLYISIR